MVFSLYVINTMGLTTSETGFFYVNKPQQIAGADMMVFKKNSKATE